jgi:hypothetical protein
VGDGKIDQMARSAGGVEHAARIGRGRSSAGIGGAVNDVGKASSQRRGEAAQDIAWSSCIARKMRRAAGKACRIAAEARRRRA